MPVYPQAKCAALRAAHLACGHIYIYAYTYIYIYIYIYISVRLFNLSI